MTKEFNFILTVKDWVPKKYNITPKIIIEREYDDYISGTVFVKKNIFAAGEVKFSKGRIRIALSMWLAQEQGWEKEQLSSVLIDSGIMFRYIINDKIRDSDLPDSGFYKQIV